MRPTISSGSRPGSWGGSFPGSWSSAYGLSGLLDKYDSPLALLPGVGLVEGSGNWATWQDQSGNGNHVNFTVNAAYGTDNEGRDCIAGTGTQWGQVAYGATYTQPFLRAVVCTSTDVSADIGYLVDGLDTDHRVSIREDGDDTWNHFLGGTTMDSLVPATSNWAVITLLANGAGTKLYLNGVAINSADSGSDSLNGLTLMSHFSESLQKWKGQVAEVRDLVNLSNLNQAVSDANSYLAWNHGL